LKKKPFPPGQVRDQSFEYAGSSAQTLRSSSGGNVCPHSRLLRHPLDLRTSNLDLEFDSDGRVILAFTPDFYLPDQDLYIELTTLRPHLSTKKNKKMRLMAELYPGINIKLMKRREMRDMMVKYGLYDVADTIQGTDSQKKAE